MINNIPGPIHRVSHSRARVHENDFSQVCVSGRLFVFLGLRFMRKKKSFFFLLSIR